MHPVRGLIEQTPLELFHCRLHSFLVFVAAYVEYASLEDKIHSKYEARAETGLERVQFGLRLEPLPCASRNGTSLSGTRGSRSLHCGELMLISGESCRKVVGSSISSRPASLSRYSAGVVTPLIVFVMVPRTSISTAQH